MKQKISERELENFICQYPAYSLWEGMEIIGRQITLSHGRLDILAWDGKRTIVIELKARPLEEKDIGQVLRYTYDVKTILEQVGILEGPIPQEICTADMTPQEKQFDKAWGYYHGMDTGFRELAIKPILIGTHVNSDVLAACRAADIGVRFWKYDSKSGYFKIKPPNHIQCFTELDSTTIPAWACQISTRIQQTCKDDIAYLETEDDIDITIHENWRFIPWRQEGSGL